MSKISKFSQVLAFSKKYPITRGMASYALIWPVGSIVQQTIVGEEKYDFAKVARFCLYGSCYVAPTLHCWLRIANTVWPLNTLRSAMTKAIIEQFTYTPFAMVSFYFGMTLLEGKTVEDGKAEVEAKFLPTYKIGALVWPLLQTFNYTMIRERNRVVFVSVCSLMWTSFLAYMKHLEPHEFIKDTNQNQMEDENLSTSGVRPIHNIQSEATNENSWIIGRHLDR